MQSARVDYLFDDLGRWRRVKRRLLAALFDGLCEGRVVIAKGNSEGRFAFPKVTHRLISCLNVCYCGLGVHVVLQHHVQLLNLELALVVATHEVFTTSEKFDIVQRCRQFKSILVLEGFERPDFCGSVQACRHYQVGEHVVLL